MMQLLESELAPESILPARLFERPFGGARVQAEKRLQVAVPADAVLRPPSSPRSSSPRSKAPSPCAASNAARGRSSRSPAFAALLPTVQAMPGMIQAEDIAAAAVFLASDETRFVNGHDLIVDGGITAGRPAATMKAAWQTLAEGLRFASAS
jgi:hypothetical protein